MRIGIIAHLKYPIAEPFAGGLEMHTHMLASKLRDRGHEVTVFASTKSSSSIGVEPICAQTELDLFGNDGEEIAFFKEHHAYLTLMNHLRHAPFDVIHNNSLHYLPLVMADALRVPMVTTLHTPPFNYLASGMRIAKGRNINLVAVSESIRREWADVVSVPEVILNGVDLSNFHFHPHPSEEPYLVWYGRIVAEKGLHYAIDATRMLGMSLRFAGPISDSSYFATEIEPRLGRDTHYAGHLCHKDLCDLVGGARVSLCTPCWEEPYGLVVPEALACGTPVAAFARGAIPTILNASCGRLAVPDCAHSLADAARMAMTLKRVDCRRRAETFCDAEVMVDSYETLYRRVTGATVPSSVVSMTDANSFLAD